MFDFKKEIIDNFSLTDSQFLQLQAELTAGKSALYHTLIVAPLSIGIGSLIKVEYPSLIEEREDILTDVFLKLKKQINKKDFQTNYIEIRELLVRLTRTECDLAMPSEENLLKNFGLSRKAFKGLLRQLQSGDESLVEHVYLKQCKRCVKYLMQQPDCGYDQAYNCTMDALLEIRKDLIKGRIFYGNLDFYFTKRAQSKWYKMKQKSTTTGNTTELDEFEFVADDQSEANLHEAELRLLIKEAIQKLCSECKQIVRLYYYEEISLKEISELLDKSHDAVRKQATRCREKLRGHLGENFYAQFGMDMNE